MCLECIFLEKYFPKDVRNKKEIKFFELKQGYSTFAEFVAKFEELVKFYPYYNAAAAEGYNCIKFESDLRPEIKVLDIRTCVIFCTSE